MSYAGSSRRGPLPSHPILSSSSSDPSRRRLQADEESLLYLEEILLYLEESLLYLEEILLYLEESLLYLEESLLYLEERLLPRTQGGAHATPRPPDQPPPRGV